MKVRVSRPLRTILMPLAMTLSLLLVITGCGTVGAGTPTTTAPTVTIAASPTTVAAGASSTLTVAAANATAVTVTGSDGSSKTMSTTGGTLTVTPAKTTTYTATASGASGTTPATATATVTVSGTTPSNPTVTLTANPTSILAGGSSTLTIATTNATAVQITGTDGSSYNVTLTSGSGTQAVSPAATTTYTATATGATGTTPATATATVTVTAAGAAPTVSISVKPTLILRGASATLTVTASNATGVTVQGTDGSLYTLPAGGGMQSVSPTTTTTYQATATGVAGTTPATQQVVLTVTQPPAPTVTIVANPTSIASGTSSLLTVTATNATSVTVTGTDGTNQTLPAIGGTVTVSPTAATNTTFTYTATAKGVAGTATNTATVTVVPAGTVQSITHVIFMLQENRSFDSYFGWLNPYRANNKTGTQPWNQGDDGTIYTVDGIDDKPNISNKGKGYAGDPTANPPIPPSTPQTIKPFKFTSTCVDDMSSAWEESFWDVNGSFSPTRSITMDGFAGNASGFAQSCVASGTCSGTFTDVNGYRAMGYYDQDFFNYYYYMASNFAVSDRWFSPVSSKTIDNRIATFSGGTTEGFVNDPQSDDHIGTQVTIPTIFRELNKANVSWKIYYTVNNALCMYDSDDCQATSSTELEPSTTFSYFTDAYQYLQHNPTPGNPAGCVSPLSPSEDIGDKNNQFCIDLNHLAPLSQYYTDLKNGTLPSFSFIEAGYGNNDEHPGSGQSVLAGQQEVSYIVNSLMQSTAWDNSVFFLAYDEVGGPYDHVPPVPGHSNDFTDAAQKALYPDIGGGTVNGVTYSNIAVAPDRYAPCVPLNGVIPTMAPYCDLSKQGEPGTAGTTLGSPGVTSDVVTEQGFGAQIGFRVPNMVVSPFVKRHYVSHIPMDHEAIIRFVEDRFINDGSTGSPKYLTMRDASEPNLLDFFDFTNVPWASPPTPPTATTNSSSCKPNSLGN
jgi:phospholipase C